MERLPNFNVVAIVDDTGAVQERYRYTPYGRRTALNANFTVHADPHAGGHAFAIGHQGLHHDGVAGAGLVYNRARMLHPVLGRFVQRDPLRQTEPGGGYQDGMNLYQYVRSVPIDLLDPSGMVVYTPKWCYNQEKYDECMRRAKQRRDRGLDRAERARDAVLAEADRLLAISLAECANWWAWLQPVCIGSAYKTHGLRTGAAWTAWSAAATAIWAWYGTMHAVCDLAATTHVAPCEDCPPGYKPGVGW